MLNIKVLDSDNRAYNDMETPTISTKPSTDVTPHLMNFFTKLVKKVLISFTKLVKNLKNNHQTGERDLKFFTKLVKEKAKI